MTWAAVCLLLGIACGDVPPVSNHVPATHVPSATPPVADIPRAFFPMARGFYFECDVQPPVQFAQLYVRAARQYPSGLPACMLARQGHAESAFKPNAISKAGALGIAQFMPDTAREMGIDPLDPSQAIPAQAKYMVWSKSKWTPELGGRTDDDLLALSLSTYNYGAGNMFKNQRRNGWILYKEAEPKLPKETRDYVRKIMQ